MNNRIFVIKEEENAYSLTDKKRLERLPTWSVVLFSVKSPCLSAAGEDGIGHRPRPAVSSQTVRVATVRPVLAT